MIGYSVYDLRQAVRQRPCLSSKGTTKRNSYIEKNTKHDRHSLGNFIAVLTYDQVSIKTANISH